MNNEEEQELLKKKLLARFRFRSLCRKVCANAYWLNAIEDKQLSSNPKRNIAIIVRRSGVKGILTLKEKSIFNTPAQYRSDKDREILRSTIMSLKCFEMIPPKVRETLMQSCNFQFFNAGRVITREGHHANAIYFLLDGEISVSQRVYSYGDGKWIDDTRYALMPGDMFGLDGIIYGSRRAVTCTTAKNTEILCIYKDDLNDQLRTTLILLWDQIKAALKRFAYYFYHFTEQQITECCTFSKIRQYNLDDVIYDNEEGKLQTAFFILNGQCMILQCLNITCKLVKNKKHFELLDVQQHDHSKAKQQKNPNNKKSIKDRSEKARNNNMENAPMEHMVKFDDNEKINKEAKDIVFLDVATLSAGSIFGIGEDTADRLIVAKNVVQCLEIPRFWLLERTQNIGNIWERTKIFYMTTIPSRQDIFADYVRTSNWNARKIDIVKKLFDSIEKL